MAGLEAGIAPTLRGAFGLHGQGDTPRALTRTPRCNDQKLGRVGRLDSIASGLQLSLGIVKATFARSDRPAGDLTVDRLLDVLVEHAQVHPTVVIFDECSSIGRVDGAAGLLRTRFQHYYQQMGLIFAGSEPSVMRLLFTALDQPFYAQADLVDLAPLGLDSATAIIDDGFDGSPPPALAARIHDFTGGHPQRSTQLADAAWQTVWAGADGANGLAVWAEALQRCRARRPRALGRRCSTAARSLPSMTGSG